MRLRHPPGRGGRLWLKHRSRVATSAAELLDKKRRALVQEHRRLRVVARNAEAEWQRSAAEAETWVNRAAVLAGEEEIELLIAQRPAADVTIRWRSAMGVVFASEANLELGPAAAMPAGGSAAADVAVPAARAALEAAVKDAAARSAFRRVAAELAITARRQRALNKRWLPALAEATARLTEALDEFDREEAVRSVWAGRREAAR